MPTNFTENLRKSQKITENLLKIFRKCLMKNLSRNCLDGRYHNKANTSMILASIKFSYSTKDFDGKLRKQHYRSLASPHSKWQEQCS